jgi:hypothetical protein
VSWWQRSLCSLHRIEELLDAPTKLRVVAAALVDERGAQLGWTLESVQKDLLGAAQV